MANLKIKIINSKNLHKFKSFQFIKINILKIDN